MVPCSASARPDRVPLASRLPYSYLVEGNPDGGSAAQRQLLRNQFPCQLEQPFREKLNAPRSR